MAPSLTQPKFVTSDLPENLARISRDLRENHKCSCKFTSTFTKFTTNSWLLLSYLLPQSCALRPIGTHNCKQSHSYPILITFCLMCWIHQDVASSMGLRVVPHQNHAWHHGWRPSILFYLIGLILCVRFVVMPRFNPLWTWCHVRFSSVDPRC